MKYLFITLLAAFIFSCSLPEVPKNLPMYGFHDVDPATGDTIYHTIPDFSFLNQDSLEVTNATFAGKAYVADFFFTSCPTICPKVKQQMMRLYEKYRNDDRLLLLSYTIDPKRDTVGKLRDFAGRMGVTSDKWHFVTGDKDKIYALADDYMSIATENPEAPGGFDHSGWLLLIDKDRHIRAYCNGTKPEEVTRFMEDIDWLLAQ
ncbi:MAG: SCO family protein [Saprospiraceae bacterium]